MVDINDLVQEFWRTSSDKAVGASILPLRHLLGIFQDILKVCFVVSVFATAVDYDKSTDTTLPGLLRPIRLTKATTFEYKWTSSSKRV